MARIKEHLRFYSTEEKLKFPEIYEYWPEVLDQATELSKDKSLFIVLEDFENQILFLRKTRDPENLDIYIDKLYERPDMPEDINELFNSFQIFRTYDVISKTCDCSCFFKLGYCKHSREENQTKSKKKGKKKK